MTAQPSATDGSNAAEPPKTHEEIVRSYMTEDVGFAPLLESIVPLKSSLSAQPLISMSEKLGLRRRSVIQKVALAMRYDAAGRPTIAMTVSTTEDAATSSWLSFSASEVNACLASMSSADPTPAEGGQQGSAPQAQSPPSGSGGGPAPGASPSSSSSNLMQELLQQLQGKITPALLYQDCTQQSAVDDKLKALGLPIKVSMLASSAVCKLGAKIKKIPLFRHIQLLSRGEGATQQEDPLAPLFFPVLCSAVGQFHYMIPNTSYFSSVSHLVHASFLIEKGVRQATGSDRLCSFQDSSSLVVSEEFRETGLKCHVAEVIDNVFPRVLQETFAPQNAVYFVRRTALEDPLVRPPPTQNYNLSETMKEKGVMSWGVHADMASATSAAPLVMAASTPTGDAAGGGSKPSTAASPAKKDPKAPAPPPASASPVPFAIIILNVAASTVASKKSGAEGNSAQESENDDGAAELAPVSAGAVIEAINASKANGVLFSPCNFSTFSEMIQTLKKVKESHPTVSIGLDSTTSHTCFSALDENAELGGSHTKLSSLLLTEGGASSGGNFLVHLAVGLQCSFAVLLSPHGGHATGVWNEYLRLEEKVVSEIHHVGLHPALRKAFDSK